MSRAPLDSTDASPADAESNPRSSMPDDEVFDSTSNGSRPTWTSRGR